MKRPDIEDLLAFAVVIMIILWVWFISEFVFHR